MAMMDQGAYPNLASIIVVGHWQAVNFFRLLLTSRGRAA